MVVDNFIISIYGIIIDGSLWAIPIAILLATIFAHYILGKYRTVLQLRVLERVTVSILWWGLLAVLISTMIAVCFRPNETPALTARGVMIMNTFVAIGMAAFNIVATRLDQRHVRVGALALIAYLTVSGVANNVQTIWQFLPVWIAGMESREAVYGLDGERLTSCFRGWGIQRRRSNVRKGVDPFHSVRDTWDQRLRAFFR